METTVISPFDWFFLILLVLILIVFSYEAYMNLYLGKVSKFSIDALLIFLIVKFGSDKARKKANAFHKDVDRIFLMGIYSVLFVVGATVQIIRWLERNT